MLPRYWKTDDVVRPGSTCRAATGEQPAEGGHVTNNWIAP